MIKKMMNGLVSTRKRAGLLAALAGLSVFWACHLNDADNQDHFDLKADSTLAKCDSVLVILEDADGHPVDTLFKDKFVSVSQLSNLSVGKYAGGDARVHIVGYKEGNLCIEQTRAFNDKGGSVTIDTLALPGALPKTIEIKPSSLEIVVGDASVEVTALIKPAFAAQEFEWSVDDASVANLDYRSGPNAGKVFVVPQKNGTATLRARAKRDTAVSAELVVHVGSVSGRTVSIVPDSVNLFLGGPDTVLTANVFPEDTGDPVTWTSSDEKVAKVDANGKLKAIGEGSTTIKAKFGGASASAGVRVKRDVPVLTVASKTGAAVNVPITFTPKVTQDFGSIILFKWDLLGDGAWDDSLPGPFLGNSVDLPPQTAKYPTEGNFKARFLVRDSEGNEATAIVSIDIGNQPPEITQISHDTIISIKDSIPLRARARDLEGKVVWIGWDFENDGKFDDSAKGTDSILEIKSGHLYSKVGLFSAVLRVEDDAKKVRTDTVKVRVLLLPPKADMGNDTTVIAGTPVKFKVLGKDSLGTILKRELKIGSGSFFNMGSQDTTILVPGDSGTVSCIGRVTDDDGNTDEDTMVVTLKVPSKSNNDLAGLSGSAGALSPGFKPLTLLYSLLVAYADSQVTVTASTSDPAATVAINGKPVASGTPSDPVDIKVGTTQDAFKVVVTAQDGSQKSYAIAVTRAPSTDTRLAKLEPVALFTLKPAFSPAVLNYADTVAFAVASVSIKPTVNHPSAKVTVNDTVVVSGSASKALPLIVGDNLIKIEVTAQDGKTKATYTVKLVRRAKVILSRLLAGNTVLVDSLEAPLGTTVPAKIGDSTGFHFVKWTVTEGTGTLADSAANPGALTVKSATVRATGVWAINTYKIISTIKGFAGGQFDFPSITIDHGKDTTLKVTPLVGYRVLTLTDNGNAVSTLGSAGGFGVRTFKIANATANHAIEATFLKTYDLTTSVTGTGTISPLGTVEVDSGSTREFSLASGSPATGIIISSLIDNEKDVVGSVTGDPMNASKYVLSGIDANHVIVANFAVKRFTMKVTGHDLCIQQVVTCPDIRFCLHKLCLLGSGPDSDSLSVPYGSTWTIRTADSSAGKQPLINWNINGTLVGNVTNPQTISNVTSDQSISAVYRSIIIRCCPGACCVIGDPILTQPISTSPSMSTEPVPVLTPLLQEN
ncbi:MAG: Cadherin-like beta sandwich domain protein [Fibrobacteres bacterium]|nr:Cadherin-like beta sandwich domain protein [Fibrobacterota bacterium]